ncbi:MAG: cbb3-type cytochrome c oxidase N-terminal domain-containing protein [Pseudobdellovibrionaceae bacterium]
MSEEKQDSQNQKKEAELLDHSYDGIQEYDNPLPNWWLMTFFGTIIFSFIYFIHYQFGGGQNQIQELEVSMKELPKAAEKIWSEQELQAQSEGHERLEEGKRVFAAKCAACHAAEGQGMIGPNLTDKFWLHGKGHRADLIKVISKGVTEKGMPAWEGLVNEKEMLGLVGYVYSLRKTKPAQAKAPQGVEVTE